MACPIGQSIAPIVLPDLNVNELKELCSTAEFNYDMALRQGELDQIIPALELMGSCQIRFRNYDLALEHFIAADSLLKIYPNPERAARVQYRLACIYIEESKFDSAKEFLHKAINYFESTNNNIWTAYTRNQLAAIELKSGNYSEAEALYTDLLNYVEKQNILHNKRHVLYKDLGICHRHLKNTKQAIELYRQALAVSMDQEDYQVAGKMYEELGKSYEYLSDFGKARKYFESGRTFCTEHDLQDQLFEMNIQLAKMEERSGNFVRALSLTEAAYAIEDSLFRQEQHAIINQLNTRLSSKRADLKEEKKEILRLEKQVNRLMQTILLITAGLLGLMVIGAAVFTYYYRELRIQAEGVRLDLEHDVSEAKSDLEEAEKFRQKLELNISQKETTNLINVVEENNLSTNHLLEEIEKLASEAPDHVRNKLEKMHEFVRTNFKSISRKQFDENVMQYQKRFQERLVNRFPQLTEGDQQLASMLLMDLSTREIASLRGISVNSAKMSRYRLRKKLGLNPHQDIHAFLQEI